MSPRSKLLTHQRRTASIVARLERTLGTPRQSRRLPGPLEMLIATLLSQNTNDQNSHRAWQLLRQKFPRWELVLAAPVSRIASAIKVGGMKNQKAERIRGILRRLKIERGALSLRFLAHMKNEEALEYLRSFKGIGTKTAACVLVFSLGRDVFPVDTHVHRLCNRLGLVDTSTPDETFETMQPLVPSGKAYSFHTNLIRFGRSVCKAQRPRCGGCPLFDVCVFPKKQSFAKRLAVMPHSTPKTDFMLLDHVS
jgi:endonuclease-3